MPKQRMKFQLASDLHLEHYRGRFLGSRALAPAPGAEALILAGDIGHEAEGLAEFTSWPIPVIAVGGNHEAYGSTLESARAKSRALGEASNIRFLECDITYFPGIRVLGCTLWTDYAIYGTPELARHIAGQLMSDHIAIKTAQGRPFRPEHASDLHIRHRNWLAEQLGIPFDGKTVVVTHHGPHPFSESPRYRNNHLNPAYFSDLRGLMKHVDVWIHGHTHDSVQFEEGNCRIICNPRGYPLNARNANTWADVQFENKAFDPALVVDV